MGVNEGTVGHRGSKRRLGAWKRWRVLEGEFIKVSRCLLFAVEVVVVVVLVADGDWDWRSRMILKRGTAR